jgi:hypothetical protein
MCELMTVVALALVSVSSSVFADCATDRNCGSSVSERNVWKSDPDRPVAPGNYEKSEYDKCVDRGIITPNQCADKYGSR